MSSDRLIGIWRGLRTWAKDAAAIRAEFQARLGQMARELGRELYPEGLPRGTKFSELEAIAECWAMSWPGN